mgnify:CR=1 FL=1
MNTPRFDYFIALARERSFTKAAKQLHITQQTLSNYVAQLEKEIGSTLFVRNIPLNLTYAGEIYLRYALAIQNQIENMQHELDDVSQKERGLLKIGIAFFAYAPYACTCAITSWRTSFSRRAAVS